MKSPVLSLQWDLKSKHKLFCGCQDGTFVMIADIKDTETMFEILTGIQAPIYCIDSHASSGNLAVGVGCEVHIAREMSKSAYVTFTVMPEPPSLPRHLVSDDTSEDRDNRVRARAISCWDINTRSALWVINPAHRHQHIGYAAISPNNLYILVSNLTNGLDLYPMGESNVLQSYRYATPADKNYPLTVDFLHDGNTIVCGSPTGKVPIWNTKTGVHMQTLSHDGLSYKRYLAHHLISVTYRSHGPGRLCKTRSFLSTYKIA
ncbi:WD40-repeat-containing domain protein [Hygrophoropsis aurantiaca]|uniref:WD40-repeat-containing domain protein n=1 Tax=Hygrophoropsis aurantiaca TaxID=72124 RepID=A0ACB8A513_9AGAM|nr:WD40-repeat-containing domain protein [Hygrophoropsis aurantiaca]